jgi:sulfide:quinone oxidoreductase
VGAAQSVVILGGGVGGLVAANELARRLGPSHRITLVERSAQHAFAPSFLWLMTGDRRASQITRDVRRLVHPRVEVVQAEAHAIDWTTARIDTEGGPSIPFDSLLIALGAQLAPEAIPGLAEAGHTFYTLEGAQRLRQALQGFTGGTVAVVVSSLPYKCPGAPHEAAMLLRDHFECSGLRGRVDVHLFTPEPQAMPVAGPELGAAVSSMLESRGIAFHPLRRLTSVKPESLELAFDGQPPFGCDMLVAIPPHRGPRLVREAGLANDAGWVPVDRRSLATRRERVYAIGDVTTIPIPGRWLPNVPLMLPKAGVFAHAQALVVAQRIAAELDGASARAEFCGDGYCMLEAGEDLAGFAFGNFFAEPAPEIRLRQVGRGWHLGKVLFEKWWLMPLGMRRRALELALTLGGRAYGVPVELSSGVAPEHGEREDRKA